MADRTRDEADDAAERDAGEKNAAERDAAAAAAAEDERPHSHRRSGGSSGFGTSIAGIMHGIDADIFRDPASIQRMQRDSNAVVRTADGTVVGIELPGEGVIAEPDHDEDEPGTNNPGTDEPGTRDPGTRDPGTREPGTDEPVLRRR